MKRALALSLPALLAACAAPIASRDARAPVTVGILAINDFHGALEPPRTAVPAPDGKGGIVPVPAGGAAWLASAVDSIRSKYANSITVGAGDLISASQLASSLYLDEPAIGVLNRIGLDLSAVGNHEFDQGRAELLRKQNGGCARHATRDPCQLEAFAGARYRYLAASTIDEHGHPLFPATAVRSFGKGRGRVRVGFVGLTLKGTTSLVSPQGIAGLRFADEAETINTAVPRLRRQGADAVVVLIHEGGRTAGPPNPDGCEGLSGDLLPILERLDAGVDVVVSGHTHWSYVCDWRSADGKRSLLLTSAGVWGQMVTDIELAIDPVSRRVVSRRADNVIVQSPGYAASSSRGPVLNTALYPQFAPRADVAEYVRRYTEAARQFTQRPVGRVSGPAPRSEGGAMTVSPLGNLIADAQRAASGAQIALMNPFGIRAALNPAADGAVTFGDIYAVQPFANTIVTQTLTGAELKAVLEEGLDDVGPNQQLNPSDGMVITIDMARPAGSRVVSLMLNGAAIDPVANYRVTTNSFLAGGGDGFTGLARKRDATVGMPDIEAFELWLKSVPVRGVPTDERVRLVGG